MHARRSHKCQNNFISISNQVRSLIQSIIECLQHTLSMKIYLYNCQTLTTCIPGVHANKFTSSLSTQVSAIDSVLFQSMDSQDWLENSSDNCRTSDEDYMYTYKLLEKLNVGFPDLSISRMSNDHRSNFRSL